MGSFFRGVAVRLMAFIYFSLRLLPQLQLLFISLASFSFVSCIAILVCMFLSLQYWAVTATVPVKLRRRVMVSLTIQTARATDKNGMIPQFIVFS
jgi:hypothetical protein